MRQQLEILVMTSVDVDKHLATAPGQEGNERRIKDAIKTALEVIGPIGDDNVESVELEYGEPV